MIAIRSTVAGAYHVRDESQPIPLGKTMIDVSVVVRRYRFGWVCGEDGHAGLVYVNRHFTADTTRAECEHIKAAQGAES